MAQLGRFLAAERRGGGGDASPLSAQALHADEPCHDRAAVFRWRHGGLANSVARYVGTAHSHSVPLRIDEMNAISCGGVRGVSYPFASALWAVDALFEMARVGG
jgi:hypothetical protein